MAGNPRNQAEARAWLLAQTRRNDRQWVNRCDGLCANAYGWAHSGELSAIAHWNNLPENAKTRTKDVDAAPAGSLVFFAPNHIVTSDGGGWCYSNDIVRMGGVDRVKISNITNGAWHLTPLGWTPPLFPRGSGRSQVPPLQPDTSSVADAPTGSQGSPAVVTTPPDVAQVLPADVTSAEWWQRGLMLGAGVGLLYVAYLLTAGGSLSSVLNKISVPTPEVG